MLASLPAKKQSEILAHLGPDDWETFEFCWPIFARPDQRLPEGDWHNWLILAGRGWGKTRTGAESIRELVCGQTPLERGQYQRVALIAETAADARDVMVEGNSGIMGVHPPAFRPMYEPSKRRLTWPNGATATLFNATEPDQLRGPQFDLAWCFVAGTKVATPTGDVPIERVRKGELVLTSAGPRRVVATRSREANVGSVSFENGTVLIGTADHKVYTSHGWMAMEYLSRGDQACAIIASNGAAKNGTHTGVTTSERTRRPSLSALSAFTGRFMRAITDLSRQAMTSTMSMVTFGTMASPILNASRAESIGNFTFETSRFRGRTGHRSSGLRFCARAAALFNGVRSSGGFCASRANSGEPTSGARNGESAASAATCLCLAPATFAVSVASTWQPMGRAKVYCLTVEDQPEFFANGILVHNCDELAKWRYAQETWDMLMFGLRLGDHPKTIITTTPRPLPIVKQLLKDAGTVVTRGSTYDNRANLASTFIKQVEAKYEGTRLGRQELNAEVLDDAPGALWSRSLIDDKRVKADQLPDMQRVVVAIDPAAEGTEDGHSETGIICAGLGVDGRGYLLDDQSCRLGPLGWARRAIATYDLNSADCIVAELNQGGAMVEHTIRSVRDGVPFRGVRASRGKVTRAEPIAALYEQGRISHVGAFPELEDQMVLFTAYGIEGDGAADRVDALVWAFSELFPRMVRQAVDEDFSEFTSPMTGAGAWMA